MGTIVTVFNIVTTKIFDIMLLPFLSLPPIWPVIFISLVAGVLILWIFGKVSNQTAIRVVRNRMRGNVIAIRLFQDEIATLLRLQVSIVADTARYMKYSLIPMVILLAPMLVFMIQLNLRFNDRPLGVGEKACVKIRVRDQAAMQNKPAIEVPPGLTLETPPVVIPSEREVAWRVRADKAGEYVVKVAMGNESAEKKISVGSGWKSVTSVRSNSAIERLLYPGESPLGQSSIASISVDYPRQAMTCFGFNVHWLVAFFVLSIAFSFAFKNAFGVEI